MYDDVFGSISYIPGITDRKPELLSRYLPTIPDGVISKWLPNNITLGSWILDPFGALPRLAIEIARAGYKLLVTVNNPIARFLLELSASPPNPEDLQSALAELSSSYKGDERMEPHILSLYNTRCSRCGQIISADVFLWEQGSTSPYARIYTCPYCGDSGEHPCIQFDIEQANQFAGSSMHKARALERVISSNDPDRIHVEQALSVYPPRALYALITIINKIEGLHISSQDQKNLAALLLYAFDQSNAMWRITSSRERRRQLTIPRHFRENNIWLALEQGIEIWRSKDASEENFNIPITTWPNLPPETGGICIYEGRLINISDALPNLNIKAVCSAIPRPNQAYWTLSALWAGWLWGREAVGSFKSVLHRQRYDWSWHTTALASVFKQLANILDPSTLILGLMGEIEPGFIASALIAARYADCDLQGIAIRNEEDQAQILWKCKSDNVFPKSRATLSELGSLSVKSYLENRGEPANYLITISAAFMSIIQSWLPQLDNQNIDEKDIGNKQSTEQIKINPTEPTPSLIYSTIYNAAREALTYRMGFLRFKFQDLLDIQPSSKPQILQESLFSVDIAKINTIEEDEEYSNPETAGIDSAQEKERTTRSSDVSESELLWLRNDENANQCSITDNLELAILNFLTNHSLSNYVDLDEMVCQRFPGLYTPDPNFIRICLDSYGEQDQYENNVWMLRPEDKPAARQADIEHAYTHISQIGERLGLKSISQHSGDISSIILINDSGETLHRFILTITAKITEIVLGDNYFSGKSFLVIPGSRANLIIYKLRRDPRLIKAFSPTSGSWQFLKFRHLSSLAENPLLSLENFEQLLKHDPLTFSTPQLRLI